MGSTLQGRTRSDLRSGPRVHSPEREASIFTPLLSTEYDQFSPSNYHNERPSSEDAPGSDDNPNLYELGAENPRTNSGPHVLRGFDHRSTGEENLTIDVGNVHLEVADLDHFFVSVYEYFLRKGFWPSILSRFLNLVQAHFVVLVTVVLAACVDYRALFRTYDFEASIRISGIYSLHPLLFMVLLVYLVIWSYMFVQLVRDLPSLVMVGQFYHEVLGIQEEMMESTTWPEITSRLIKAQTRTQFCDMHADITDLDIANHIMREENFLIALFNKDVIPLHLTLPFVGTIPYFPKSLEWSVRKCVMGYVFDRKHRVHPHFRMAQKRTELAEGLTRRLRLMAVLNLILAPFVIPTVSMYFFFRYAEEFRRNPQSMSLRHWSPYMRWTCREFNELSHVFARRLSLASYPAELYVNAFSSATMAVLARFVSFIAGSFVAVLMVLTLIDEDFLNVHVTPERSVLWYIGVFGAVLAGSRALIPDVKNEVEPIPQMLRVVHFTHYLPITWKQQGLASRLTRKEFSRLYEFKALFLIQETLSVAITPFILWFTVPKYSQRIIDLFRETVMHKETVGDVCAFAMFDFQDHPGILSATGAGQDYLNGGSIDSASKLGVGIAGDTTVDVDVDFGPSGSANTLRVQHHQPGVGAVKTTGGKMEKSFINFVANNPHYLPGSSGQQFLTNLDRYQNTASHDPFTSLPPPTEHDEYYMSGAHQAAAHRHTGNDMHGYFQQTPNTGTHQHTPTPSHTTQPQQSRLSSDSIEESLYTEEDAPQFQEGGQLGYTRTHGDADGDSDGGSARDNQTTGTAERAESAGRGMRNSLDKGKKAQQHSTVQVGEGNGRFGGATRGYHGNDYNEREERWAGGRQDLGVPAYPYQGERGRFGAPNILVSPSASRTASGNLGHMSGSSHFGPMFGSRSLNMAMSMSRSGHSGLGVPSSRVGRYGGDESDKAKWASSSLNRREAMQLADDYTSTGVMLIEDMLSRSFLSTALDHIDDFSATPSPTPAHRPTHTQPSAQNTPKIETHRYTQSPHTTSTRPVNGPSIPRIARQGPSPVTNEHSEYMGGSSDRYSRDKDTSDTYDEQSNRRRQGYEHGRSPSPPPPDLHVQAPCTRPGIEDTRKAGLTTTVPIQTRGDAVVPLQTVPIETRHESEPRYGGAQPKEPDSHIDDRYVSTQTRGNTVPIQTLGSATGVYESPTRPMVGSDANAEQRYRQHHIDPDDDRPSLVVGDAPHDETYSQQSAQGTHTHQSRPSVGLHAQPNSTQQYGESSGYNSTHDLRHGHHTTYPHQQDMRSGRVEQAIPRQHGTGVTPSTRSQQSERCVSSYEQNRDSDYPGGIQPHQRENGSERGMGNGIGLSFGADSASEYSDEDERPPNLSQISRLSHNTQRLHTGEGSLGRENGSQPYTDEHTQTQRRAHLTPGERGDTRTSEFSETMSHAQDHTQSTAPGAAQSRNGAPETQTPTHPSHNQQISPFPSLAHNLPKYHHDRTGELTGRLQPPSGDDVSPGHARIIPTPEIGSDTESLYNYKLKMSAHGGADGGLGATSLPRGYTDEGIEEDEEYNTSPPLLSALDGVQNQSAEHNIYEEDPQYDRGNEASRSSAAGSRSVSDSHPITPVEQGSAVIADLTRRNADSRVLPQVAQDSGKDVQLLAGTVHKASDGTELFNEHKGDSSETASLSSIQQTAERRQNVSSLGLDSGQGSLQTPYADGKPYEVQKYEDVGEESNTSPSLRGIKSSHP